MRQNRLIVLVISLLVAGVFASSATADVTIVPVDAPAPLINPCTGEEVTLGGTLRVVSNAAFDPSGDVHRADIINLEGVTATASSGTEYIVSGTRVSQFSGTDAVGTGSFEYTQVFTTTFIAPGSATGSFVGRIIVHTTVSEGEPVVTIETDTTQCLGASAM